MNFKPTFFTSDWHIGHENVLKYDERPFATLSEMNEALIKRYNGAVPESGICYFLGDMGNRTEEMREVFPKLNGTKVLILGNHDKGMTTMYNAGFDVVLNSASIFIGDHRITMSHCPLPGIQREDTSEMKGFAGQNWHGENRESNKKHIIQDEGQFHLHGHIHSRKDNSKSKRILGRQMDVGVAANNYTPVSLSQIESWIAQYIKNNSK